MKRLFPHLKSVPLTDELGFRRVPGIGVRGGLVIVTTNQGTDPSIDGFQWAVFDSARSSYWVPPNSSEEWRTGYLQGLAFARQLLTVACDDTKTVV